MIPQGLLPGVPIDFHRLRIGDVIDTYDPESSESRFHRRFNQTVINFDGLPCDIHTDYDMVCRHLGLTIQLRHRPVSPLGRREQRVLVEELHDLAYLRARALRKHQDMNFSLITLEEEITTVINDHAEDLGYFDAIVAMRPTTTSLGVYLHQAAYEIPAAWLTPTPEHQQRLDRFAERYRQTYITACQQYPHEQPQDTA